MTKEENWAGKPKRVSGEREEFIKRENYKLEFMKRNKRKWEEFKERRCRLPKENPNSGELKSITEIYHEFVKYFPGTFFQLLSIPNSEIPNWQVNTLSIEVLFPSAGESSGGPYFRNDDYDYLHYENNKQFLDIAMKKRESERRNPLLAVDAVNDEDKTIGVMIHLDRNKDDILKDLSYLLNLLEEEAGLLGMEIHRPKKRPTKDSVSIYEKYDLYLRIWDLKERGRN